MRVGVVLGAGGLKGHAFHVGTLTALQRHTGWDAGQAAIVVGTSAGAGMASYLRGGLDPEQLFDRLHRPSSASRDRFAAMKPAESRDGRRFRPQAPHLVARELSRIWRARPLVLATGALPEGRLSTDPIGSWARELHGRSWPTDPVWITTVRLRDGRRVVFGRDPDVGDPDIATAVEASSAVPAVFKPVEIEGDRYVDGGVHSPTNADLLADRALELDLVIISSPMSASADVARLDQRRLHHITLDREADRLASAGVPVLRLEPAAEVIAAMNGPRLEAGAMAGVADATLESVGRHLTSDRVADRIEVMTG
jgi:NTE family protein